MKLRNIIIYNVAINNVINYAQDVNNAIRSVVWTMRVIFAFYIRSEPPFR